MNGLKIESGRIEAMLSQLRAAAHGPGEIKRPAADAPVQTVGFADALKASLQQVNASQQGAQSLAESFAAGDEKVSLSDVMISMQKANITFQGAVQVRNRLVSAYHDIMNMQI